MNVTIKKLKSYHFYYGDGSQDYERFAVLRDNQRIGTVTRTTDDDGASWIEAHVGTTGYRGDGKLMSVDFVIQRFKTLNEAANAIAFAHPPTC